MTWLVAVAVLLSACGSEGDEPLSQAEFAAGANGDCRRAEKQLGRLEEPKSRAQFERHVNRAGYIAQRLYDRLDALEPPRGSAKAYDEFLEVVDGNVEAIQSVQSAVSNQQFARLAGIGNSGISTEARERRYAKKLGIDACAGVTSVQVPDLPPAPPPPPREPEAAPSAGAAPIASSRAEFIAGCAPRAGAEACGCLWDELSKRYALDTERGVLAMLEDMRPALVSGNPDKFPAPFRKAVFACADAIA